MFSIQDNQDPNISLDQTTRVSISQIRLNKRILSIFRSQLQRVDFILGSFKTHNLRNQLIRNACSCRQFRGSCCGVRGDCVSCECCCLFYSLFQNSLLLLSGWFRLLCCLNIGADSGIVIERERERKLQVIISIVQV